MLFSSLEFIFLFLPVTLAIYYAVPAKFKNGILFFASLLFYAFGEIRLLPIFLLTILASYLFGRVIGALRRRSVFSRILLILAILFNLSFLIYFKYFDFLREAFLSLEPLGILLPIGISFYTFQAISYVVDVYRGDARPAKSLISFGAYIALFPQLIAGPIVKYTDIERQLYDRRSDASLIARGIRSFVCGLTKKVILANSAGAAFESFCESGTYFGALFCVFFFGMQLYFDFSGYSDMAIGLGRLFGFELVKNFDYPYISRSVSEFWRRWHVSLSSFFREYVYFPLGGSRCSRGRLVFNLLVVWTLTGIWHGASWSFLLWGLYFAVLLIVEKLFLARLLLRLPSLISRIYSLLFVFLGWLIFASDGITLSASDGVNIFSRLFFVGNSGFISHAESYLLPGLLPFCALLIIGSTPIPLRIYNSLVKKLSPLCAILPIIALALSVAYTVSSGYNPFLYFRF